MAEFCTLDELKLHPAYQRLRAATVTDPNDEEFLQMTIKAVSARFERATSRKLAKDTYTEYFSPTGDQALLQLHALPIASITSVKESISSDWSSATVWESTSYGVDSEAGLLKLRSSCFLEGFNTVQVVYVGGYDPIPDEIRYACILQSAHEAQLATKTISSSQTVGQTDTTYRVIEFLPIVNSILSTYAIMRL